MFNMFGPRDLLPEGRTSVFREYFASRDTDRDDNEIRDSGKKSNYDLCLVIVHYEIKNMCCKVLPFSPNM